MIYDLSTPIGINQAQGRFRFLLEKKCKIDITEKRSKKTISQNNYIHLIMSYFGSQIGFTNAEVKQFVKTLNHETFHYNKKGLDLYRSFSELDKMDLSIVTNKFIEYAQNEVGISLPDPSDQPYIDECMNEVEKNQSYL